MFAIIGSLTFNRLLYGWMESEGEDVDDKLISLFTTLFGGIIISSLTIILSLYFIKPKLKAQYIDSNTYPVEMSDYILEYFEENNIEEFAQKLDESPYDIEYVNRLMTHSWGQKVIRFYDPDGNLIEVGTP